jgi:hypothetical protein
VRLLELRERVSVHHKTREKVMVIKMLYYNEVKEHVSEYSKVSRD